jgi:hypothetical protein
VVAVVLDAETIPNVDITAARMLAGLADDLERRGVSLVTAKEIGQVWDFLSARPALYTSVGDALAAVRNVGPAPATV